MTISPSNHHQIPDFVYKHRYIILGIILTDSIMASLDSSMVNIILPTITTTFQVSLAESQWVITAYLLVMTCLFIICGKISEYTGVCPLFITGSFIFTVSSLGCGLSSDLNQLIVFRIIQGIGSSMVAGISSVIIFRSFPSHEIGRTMGFSGSIFSICAMFGPTLGGMINDLWGWKYIFFINVPIGLFLFVASLKYLRIQEIRSDHFSIDWKGTTALISTIIFIFLTCSSVNSDHNILSAIPYVSAVFISGIFFLYIESRSKNPLINLAIIRNARYSIPVISGLFLTLFNFTVITLFPFYFEGTMGMKSFEVGMILMITPVIQVFASSVTGWIIDRYRWKYLAGFGLTVVSGAGFLLGYAVISLNLLFIISLMIIQNIGATFFQGQKNIDVMEALPSEQMAMASSISTTATCLGASLGVFLASILITLQMNAAGYYGAILSAETHILSSSVGYSIIMISVLCMVGAILSISIRRGNNPLEMGE